MFQLSFGLLAVLHAKRNQRSREKLSVNLRNEQETVHDGQKMSLYQGKVNKRKGTQLLFASRNTSKD